MNKDNWLCKLPTLSVGSTTQTPREASVFMKYIFVALLINRLICVKNSTSSKSINRHSVLGIAVTDWSPAKVCFFKYHSVHPVKSFGLTPDVAHSDTVPNIDHVGALLI